MQILCIAVKAVPVLCQDVPSYAMPLRIGKIHCPALLVRALLGIALLCLAFASRLRAVPRLCFSFSPLRLALPLLLNAAPRISFAPPCLSIPLPVDSLR